MENQLSFKHRELNKDILKASYLLACINTLDIIASSACFPQTDLRNSRQPEEVDPNGKESTAFTNPHHFALMNVAFHLPCGRGDTAAFLGLSAVSGGYSKAGIGRN